jgi:hypothetical protein
VVKLLPSKCKAISLNPIPQKKKEKSVSKQSLKYKEEKKTDL